MELSSTNILVSSIQPLAGTNSWLVHAYNPTGTIQTAALRWKGAGRVSIRRSDAAGQPGDRVRDFELPAFDGAYFVIFQE
jgi:hypothetical protein